MIHGTAPRWVSLWYRAAAIYGLVALLPQYALAAPKGGEVNFYGFVGTAVAFQLAFWVIGGDPARYRALMPVSVVEKLVFGVPVAMLDATGKVPATVLAFGIVDLIFGAGFLLAWRVTPKR